MKLGVDAAMLEVAGATTSSAPSARGAQGRRHSSSLRSDRFAFVSAPPSLSLSPQLSSSGLIALSLGVYNSSGLRRPVKALRASSMNFLPTDSRLRRRPSAVGFGNSFRPPCTASPAGGDWSAGLAALRGFAPERGAERLNNRRT